MSAFIQNVLPTGSVRPQPPVQINDPRAKAQAILNETSGKPVTYDRLGQIEARIDAIARTDPEFAALVRAEIMASRSLTAVDKGTLTRNEPGLTVDLNGRITSHYKPGGMEWDPWINKERTANTPEYRALAQLAKSNENEPIKAVMRELHDRGMTTEQLSTARLNEASRDSSALVADLGQLGLDIVGIFDPTPTADLINAGISAWRGDGWGAFLSTLSAVPYVGDLAKLGKLGKWAETITKAVDAAVNNPAARAMLEPSLRKISDLIGALPANAFNALPDSAKTALLEMKGKIDGMLGKAGSKVDDAAQAALNTVQRTFGKNSVEWITDAQGRLISAKATLQEVYEKLPRSPAEKAAQEAAAIKGIAGDHGGHAVGHRFLGDQGDINLFPQNGVPTAAGKNFNGSAFGKLESELADWIKAGGKVDYEVNFSNFDGARPGTVGIEYRVLNKDGVEVYNHKDRFRNEAGQIYERLSKNDIANRMKEATNGN